MVHKEYIRYAGGVKKKGSPVRFSTSHSRWCYTNLYAGYMAGVV